MKILLTNDDGIKSDGIILLAKALVKKGHEVLLVAPMFEHSGQSHALTFRDYIKCSKMFTKEKDGFLGYAIEGTPCDCVKFSLLKLKDFKPDVVLSGINDVMNVGYDLYYSGTTNAALEATLHGMKAIAFSLNAFNNDFKDTIKFIVNNLNTLYDLLGDDSQTILNVNIPLEDFKEIKGVRFTEVGKKYYNDEYIQEGENTFYLQGHQMFYGKNSKNADVEITNNGYISITPVKVEFTNQKRFKEFLKKDIKWIL